MYCLFIFNLILSIFVISMNAVDSDTTCYEPQCMCDTDDANILICNNFNSYNDLKFNINLSKIWSKVVFSQQSKLQLNNNLKLNQLKLQQNATIEIQNLESLYIYSNLFQNLNLYESQSQQKTTKSMLKLFFNSIKMNLTVKNSITNEIKIETCEFHKSKKNYLFSNLIIDELKFENVIFTNQTALCPLLFYNSKINRFSITHSMGSIRFQNILFGEDIEKTLRIDINSVYIHNTYDMFITKISSDTFFNQFLFENLVEISIKNTTITNIDSSSVEKLVNLRKLHLSNINRIDQNEQQNIFTTNINWLSNLNRKITFDLDKQKFNAKFFKSNYFYLKIDDFKYLLRDENVCFLKKFPHEHLVVTHLQPFDMNACSCAVYWFYRHYQLYETYTPEMHDINNCFQITPSDLRANLDACEIEKRLSLCTLNNDSVTIDSGIKSSTHNTNEQILNNSSTTLSITLKNTTRSDRDINCSSCIIINKIFYLFAFQIYFIISYQ